MSLGLVLSSIGQVKKIFCPLVLKEGFLLESWLASKSQ